MLQGMREKAYQVARELHRKNQANISTAQVGDEVRELLQETSRASVINILIFAGIEKKEAVQIADNEIIGSVH